MLHYIWVQKADIREPIIWTTILGILLILRVPPVKRLIIQNRQKTRARYNPAPAPGENAQ
jgi:DMSO/TMAO reductase YedYZ heme-binding membrane subunit